MKTGTITKFYFSCCAAFFFCCAAFGATADFAIAASPQSLTIYDQFEQPLSAAASAAFLPNSPFQIVRADGRLGDQITRAMQCAFGQKTYYLIRDDRGAVLGGAAGFQIVKGCAVMDDTVEITRNNAVAFSKNPAPGPAPFIAKGNTLVVLFRHKNYCYALQTGPSPAFGWIPASSRDSWKHLQQTTALDTSLTARTSDLISERIDKANAHYKLFFNAFNHSSNMQKSIPHWERAAALTWNLSAPYSRTDELGESTKYLIEDLSDILIGKQFVVRFENGAITVIPGTP